MTMADLAPMGRARRLLRIGIWLFAMLLGVNSLHAAPDQAPRQLGKLLMRPSPDASSIPGSWHLIPQPFAVVKAALESGLAERGLGGFQGRDDSAPLTSMEFYWVRVSLTHRPDVQQELSAHTGRETAPVFARALAAGVITAAERAAFEHAISLQQDFGKDALQSLPFFSQHIARWSFYRKQGRPTSFTEDYGTVMDVSQMLARTPMTLVWFSGEKTEITRSFHAFRCMTGVTCYPSPHFQRNANTTERPDPALAALLDSTAKRMQALSDMDAGQAMRGYLLAYGPQMRPPHAPARLSAPRGEPVHLDGAELPADEEDVRPPHNETWRMVALPDGSVLASGTQSHRFVRHGMQVLRMNSVPELDSAASLKVAPSGMVWGIDMASDASPRFLSWSPTIGSSRPYPLPAQAGRRIREWAILPGQAIAFRSDDDLFTLNPRGQWMRRVWNRSLRREVSNALEHTLPEIYDDGDGIRFGDDLFWQTDRDGYGVDPRTGRVTRSFPASTAGLVFGSHAARWGLALGPKDASETIRVIDLESGGPRFDVEGRAPYYTTSLARSAQGRLLAVSGYRGSALVLDMREGKPLAALQAPANYEIEAMAFSWQGDQLWLYARLPGSATRKMLVWNVPASTIDPSQGRHLPDQLRCMTSSHCS